MSYRPTRLNGFWLLLFIIVLLGAGTLVFFRLLESTIGGPVSVGQLIPAASKSPRIAILKSDYTAQVHDLLKFKGMGKSWRDSTVIKWQQLLNIRNYEAYPLTDTNIEDGDLLNKNDEPQFDVLILPSVQAMSDTEIAQIQRFIESGGTVFGTWALGIYRPDGAWRGWSFLETTFGAKFVGYVEPSATLHRITQKTLSGFSQTGLYVKKGAKQDTFKNAASLPVAFKDWRRIGPHPDKPLAQDFILADTFTAVSVQKNKTQQFPSTLISHYEWIGGDPIKQKTPLNFENGIRNFTLRGQTPLTIHVPAGYRMRVGTYDRPIMVEVNSPHTQSAGFWYDYRVEDRQVNDAVQQSSGLIYGTYGQGRFVYMGHELLAMGDKDRNVGLDPTDQKQLNAFFNNVLAWLTRQPVSWVSNWPLGYEAAATVAVVADEGALDLDVFEEIFRTERVKGSYFLPTEGAWPSQSLLDRMATSGDFGLWMNTSQKTAVSTRRQQLAQLIGNKSGATGFYQAEEIELKEAADWIRNGFQYMLIDAFSRQTLPQTHGKSVPAFVQLSKAGRNDTDIFLKGARDAIGIEGQIRSDAIRVRAEGGHYPLVMHSSGLRYTGLTSGLRGALRTLQEAHFWIASGGEVARWAQVQKGLTSAARRSSVERMVVQISNDSDVVADSVALYVYLPHPYDEKTQQIQIRPETLRMDNVLNYAQGKHMALSLGRDFDFINEAKTLLKLKMRDLKPHQYHVYQIDIKPRQPRKVAASLVIRDAKHP